MKWKLIIFVASIAVMVYGGYKVRVLTSEPGSKECKPLDPNLAIAGDKNTEERAGASIISWFQRGGTINDASCLDETAVFGVIKVQNEEDIRDALAYANSNGLKVSMAGAKHSMGGHAFSKDGVVLNMTEFNEIILDAENSSVTVQSGATWHDIQAKIHPVFAIGAMQSTDIFTVGGSISVNAHGMDHKAGAVENTIQSMRVMLADGTITKVSRTENVELYEHIVGGYGLFGVILDVELAVVPNDVYTSRRVIMPYDEFPTYFNNTILENDNIGLMYTHLSTAPGSFLDESITYIYEKSDEDVSLDEIQPLGTISNVKLRRLVINLSKYGGVMQRFKWWSEKNLEPRFESCSISRNDALGSGEACLVSRNEPMHDSVPYLQNSIPRETDILHEYFIPRENLTAFVDGMRTIFDRHQTNLLNASIRVVNAERGVLTYAPKEAFSVVLYINQKTDESGNENMKAVTKELINLTVELNGRFFLPYQLHYTKEQLTASYPNIEEFFAMKKKYDPNTVFSNTFYEKYSGMNI